MIRGLAVLLFAVAAPVVEAAEPAPVIVPPPPATAPATAPDTPVEAPVEAAPATTSESAATTSEAPQGPLALAARMEAYEQFRAHYDNERYQEALPYAQRVVELSETDNDVELSIAYNNLGATHYRLGEYSKAEQGYQRSLELLEASQGISSRRLIVPLAGLGVVFAATNQHALAAENFERALAVSRRADGLFNMTQLALIEQLANSRFAIQDFTGVERERLYEIKIYEQNYGYADPRALPSVMKLATFYETLREYSLARLMYLRARDISYSESGGFNPMVIRSLIGIARTHRLQYSLDPESFENASPVRDTITGAVINAPYRETQLGSAMTDRSGLRSAETALEMLRAASDPPRELMTDTLVELGDWYQATSRPEMSLPYYAEAATLFETEPKPETGNPLESPRLVFYRPPMAASRSRNSLTDEYVIRTTIFKLAVTEAGEPKNISVATTDMSETQLGQSRRALARAIYSPRFVDGKPVATDDVSFTAEWFESRQPPQTTPVPATPAASTPAASTPAPAAPSTSTPAPPSGSGG